MFLFKCFENIVIIRIGYVYIITLYNNNNINVSEFNGFSLSTRLFKAYNIYLLYM